MLHKQTGQMRLLRWMVVLAVLAGMLLWTGPAAAQAPVGTVTAPALNVRSGPGLAYQRIGVVYEGQTVSLLGRNAASSWLFVQTPSGQQGWIAGGEIVTSIYYRTLPVVEAGGGAPAPPAGEPPSQPAPPPASPPPAPSGAVTARVTVYALNVRSQPSLDSQIIGVVRLGEVVTLLGRSAGYGFAYAALPSGGQGWLGTRYLEPSAPLYTLPVTDAAGNVSTQPTSPPPPIPSPPANSGRLSNITSRARQIYLDGQARGNRASVFAKVGDSITYDWHFMHHIGDRISIWGDYAYLEPTANAFTPGSYKRNSAAAQPAWDSSDLLNVGLSWCGGVTPVACEYQTLRPSVSIIMIGTNESAASVASGQYRANLARVVQISIDYGVLPVLSTVPPSHIRDVSGVNAVVREVAYAYRIPLLDTYGALIDAPNHGLGPDGVHLSIPSHNNTAVFTPDGLQFGYNRRNLVTLQALDTLRRQVMY